MEIEMLPVKGFKGWKRFLESQEGFTLVEIITMSGSLSIRLAKPIGFMTTQMAMALKTLASL